MRKQSSYLRIVLLFTAVLSLMTVTGTSWAMGNKVAPDKSTGQNDCEITGTPGSPSSTTTLDGKQLPPMPARMPLSVAGMQSTIIISR